MSEEVTQLEHQEETTNGDATKGKVKFSSSMQREEAVSYFEAIVAGLKQGTLHFKQGDSSLTVTPAPYIEVEVKAAKKGREEKVSFEISWRHQEPTDLEISSS